MVLNATPSQSRGVRRLTGEGQVARVVASVVSFDSGAWGPALDYAFLVLDSTAHLARGGYLSSVACVRLVVVKVG